MPARARDRLKYDCFSRESFFNGTRARTYMLINSRENAFALDEWGPVRAFYIECAVAAHI